MDKEKKKQIITRRIHHRYCIRCPGRTQRHTVIPYEGYCEPVVWNARHDSADDIVLRVGSRIRMLRTCGGNRRSHVQIKKIRICIWCDLVYSCRCQPCLCIHIIRLLLPVYFRPDSSGSVHLGSISVRMIPGQPAGWDGSPDQEPPDKTYMRSLPYRQRPHIFLSGQICSEHTSILPFR